MYQPTEVLTSEAQLREILSDLYPSQTGKVIEEIDELFMMNEQYRLYDEQPGE